VDREDVGERVDEDCAGDDGVGDEGGGALGGLGKREQQLRVELVAEPEGAQLQRRRERLSRAAPRSTEQHRIMLQAWRVRGDAHCEARRVAHIGGFRGGCDVSRCHCVGMRTGWVSK